MNLIKFDHTCTIKRATGDRDELDNEIFETIYSGACRYQKGGQTSLSIVTRNDVVYLPQNDVLIMTNDIVDAVIDKNRPVSGKVKVVRDMAFRQFDEQITRIELKQATGE